MASKLVVASNHVSSKLRRMDAFAAGVLIGLGAVTPAFAATFPAPMEPRELLLTGSLILLAVALAMRIMRRRNADGMVDATVEEQPDLRWWRNAHAA